MNVLKIISDPARPQMKAVIFTYENEMVARLSAYRISKAVENSSLALYKGDTLFYYCKELELGCDPRSKNVTVWGFDSSVPKDIYLKLFQSLGAVNYYEFCLEGDIPFIRVEYKRLTSAMAAILGLKNAMGKEAIVAMETPLFQVPLLAPGREGQQVSRKAVQRSEIIPRSNEVKERYIMCFMNTMNYQYPEEPSMDWSGTKSRGGYENPQNYEELSMGSLSVEICRKKSFESLSARYFPNGIYGHTCRMNEETLKMLFLQATKRNNLSLKMPSKQSVRLV